LLAGVRAGEPLVLIAGQAHQQLFAEQLAARGLDLDALAVTAQLTVLDADVTLADMLVGGMPDPSLFQRAVGEVIAAAEARSKTGRVRAYGEMVDLLWRAGNAPAARALEELWNRASLQHSFSLLCAYRMSGFAQREDAADFQQVCRAHGQVMPTEDYLGLADSESRLREVSALQQRARALETEIEHRKTAEAALQDALRVRDDFLSLAGHELRTPLTVIRLQLASLLRPQARSAGNGARTQRRLEVLAAQSERLSNLADRLLDVSQLGAAPALAPRELDLATLVRECAASFSDIAASAGSRISVRADAPVIGRWDRERLQQVLQDLLSNAVKFGHGRPVQVEVDARPDHAEIRVRDGGPGIARADHARIFQRFERGVSPENFAGLGLGLWIVSRSVAAHGGTIAVESQPGQGATFRVELPYDLPGSVKAAETPVRLTSTPTVSPTRP
jgi:signal transduction histidine kinase